MSDGSRRAAPTAAGLLGVRARIGLAAGLLLLLLLLAAGASSSDLLLRATRAARDRSAARIQLSALGRLACAPTIEQFSARPLPVRLGCVHLRWPVAADGIRERGTRARLLVRVSWAREVGFCLSLSEYQVASCVDRRLCGPAGASTKRDNNDDNWELRGSCLLAG